VYLYCLHSLKFESVDSAIYGKKRKSADFGKGLAIRGLKNLKEIGKEVI